MKYSVWPNMTIPTDEVLDRARWADERGYDGVWFADHYMPNTGSEEIVRGDAHECWAMLPAIAVVTERVRIGSLVSPTSVHHPAVLANRAVTVDHLSNGRMVLGLGAGWQINEHRAYGIELEPPKRRVDRFEEAITIIRSLLDDDTTDFHGELYDITAAPADPAPIQSPLPILVGSAGQRMMRLTARFANEWNAWGDVDVAGQNRARFVSACESVGVDPTTKRTSVQALVFLTDTQEQAEQFLDGPLANRTIAGTADTLLERLHAYEAAGFDEFIVPDFNLGRSAEERSDRLERLHAEVFAPLIG
jgi:alkanesulfonate monooxygenase SsuD/methylene tetrahydromethanopterin reductase-like flavin-dependent oxidoreductase (luciferase family)